MSVKISFEDCPYHCNKGKIFDFDLKKLVPCPYCSEKRQEMASKGVAEDDSGNILSLSTLLGIENKYLSSKLVYDSIIPEGERVFLEDESVKMQSDIIEDLYLGLAVGELPSGSICFGISIKGRVDRLAYPLLAKAYLSGLTVAPFISCSAYNRLCIAMSDEVETYYNRKFVVMLINDGATKADIASAKGLMQTRALKGLPTVFITTWVVEACSMLLGYFEDENNFLARSVFVEYKKGKGGGKKSNYINQLTGVTNGAYNPDEDGGSTVGKPKNSVSLADLM